MRERGSTALDIPPLSTVVSRLFADADATEAALRAAIAKLLPEERESFLARIRADYREFYRYARDIHLAVSRETAKLLYLLARSSGARTIVEFGTSFGISTLHLAAALKDSGGGLIVTSEFEPSKVARARENIAVAGLSAFVEVREGDALETLARDLPEPIDFVLLDGAKELYPDVLALLEPRLRAGALIVADNATANPEYLEVVRSPSRAYVSLPFGDDVEISMSVTGG